MSQGFSLEAFLAHPCRIGKKFLDPDAARVWVEMMSEEKLGKYGQPVMGPAWERPDELCPNAYLYEIVLHGQLNHFYMILLTQKRPGLISENICHSMNLHPNPG